jgi:hypothetical protein
MKWLFVFLAFVFISNSVVGVSDCHSANQDAGQTNLTLTDFDSSHPSPSPSDQNSKHQECSQFCSHHVVFFLSLIESFEIEVSEPFRDSNRYPIASADLRQVERPPLV